MRKIVLIMVLVLSFSSLIFSQNQVKKSLPPWLFDNKRFSMDHSIGFSYSSYDGSLRSLYNNYFTYRFSPQLTLIGTVGYYNKGSRMSSFGSMLHGFGFEYKPNSNLLFHFHYEGVTPIKKTSGSKQ